MTIDEIRDSMNLYPHSRQDKLNLENELNRFIEQYGADVELDIVPTECAFCEIQMLSVIPSQLMFPVMCPNCGERQLYIQGEYQGGGIC